MYYIILLHNIIKIIKIIHIIAIKILLIGQKSSKNNQPKWLEWYFGQIEHGDNWGTF
jgi:hypothetical protein